MFILTLFECCLVLSFISFAAPISYLEGYGLLQETQSEILGQDIDCNNLDDCEVTKGRIGFICANNGHTYKNLCSFMMAFCTESDIKFKHHGECTASEKCQGSRRVAIKQTKTEQGVYIPTCKADGTFAAVQCHKDTTFCWCSTPAGASIPNTALSHEKPRCENLTGPPIGRAPKPSKINSKGSTESPNIHTIPDFNNGGFYPPYIPKIFPPDRPKSGKQKPPRGCEGTRKKTFNKNILQKMNQDFQRANKNTFVEPGQQLTAALNWKFLQLDKRQDGLLSRSEYKRLQKLVRANISPKKCAKKFPKLCDKNSDKRISLNEWLHCFDDETSKGEQDKRKTPPNERDKPFTRKRPPPKPKPDCTLDHKQAKETSNYNNDTLYIPKCDEKGRYQSVQCYGSHGKNLWYCFCVNVVTGKMIPNTSVQNVQPDCPVIPRPWPKCLRPKTEKNFLKNLMNHFSNLARSITSWEFRLEKMEAKQVLEIVFRKLDNNNNGQLEAKEKKKLKALLRKQKKLWKCGRRIHKVCDINYDGKITLREFYTCVLPRTKRTDHHNLVSQPVIDNRNSNRKIKKGNGFIDILKPEE